MTSAMRAGPVAIEALQWTFADRIRKIRRDVLRMEQAEFAEKLGVTRQAYAAWEAGRNEPRSILTVAKKLELMSGVPAAWVLGVDTPHPGGGVTTEVHTSQYYPSSSQVSRPLALVRPLDGTYPDVAARYGSCLVKPDAEGASEHDPYRENGNTSSPFHPGSAGTVNDANAA